MREAKRLSGRRAGRIGYQGGSQGGWVAPLAANRAHVDFVIVCFGLAVSVIDEDQQEVEIEMREKGRSRRKLRAHWRSHGLPRTSLQAGLPKDSRNSMPRG